MVNFICLPCIPACRGQSTIVLPPEQFFLRERKPTSQNSRVTSINDIIVEHLDSSYETGTRRDKETYAIEKRRLHQNNCLIIEIDQFLDRPANELTIRYYHEQRTKKKKSSINLLLQTE